MIAQRQSEVYINETDAMRLLAIYAPHSWRNREGDSSLTSGQWQNEEITSVMPVIMENTLKNNLKFLS